MSTLDSRKESRESHADFPSLTVRDGTRTGFSSSETHGVANASLSPPTHYHGPCSSCQRANVPLEWFATRIGRFYCEACGPNARHEARGTHYRVVRITLPPWKEELVVRERDRADARRAQEIKEALDAQR